MRVDSERGVIWFDEPKVAFFSDMEQDEAQPFIDALVYHTPYGQPELSSEKWQHVPLDYLVCEKDHAILVEAQRGMIEAARKEGGEIKVEELDASHSPFLSRADEMVAAIRRAAGESVWTREGVYILQV